MTEITRYTLLAAAAVVAVAMAAAAGAAAVEQPQELELETHEVDAEDVESWEVEAGESGEGPFDVEWSVRQEADGELDEVEDGDVVRLEVEAEGVDGSGSEAEPRIDSYEGEADHYHVPVAAVEGDHSHSFDAAEVSRSTFAGSDGFVVEAEDVDVDDPSVVAFEPVNDPEVDGVAHADDLETLEIDEVEDREGDEFTVEVEDSDGDVELEE